MSMTPSEKREAEAYEKEKIAYADSALRSFMYHIHNLKFCEKRYECLDLALQAQLCSCLKIKNPELAKYKKSPTFHNGGLSENIMDIFDSMDDYKKRFDDSTRELHKIGNFLRTLEDPEDLEIVIERYEWGWTITDIAHHHHMGYGTVTRRLEKILSTFTK